MRTIIELPEALKARLVELAKRDGVSMAEVVRRAVSNLLDEEKDRSSFFGIWKKKKVNSIHMQRALRKEWE